jgi:preprotein translocase subunit SecF
MKMPLLKLVPQDTHVPFLSARKLAYVLSILLIGGSIFLLSTRGLNFGIDFEGGILMEIRTEQEADIPALRDQLSKLDLGQVSLQSFGSPRDVMIRIQAQEGDESAQQKAIQTVRSTLPDAIDYRRVEFVGPQVGQELIEKGALAVFWSLAGILAYIWFRFEWQFSVAAIIALIHDSIATLGLFALTQMEFDLSTVAAVLMIAGYSINDTVVVFDRVRENLRRYRRMDLIELLDTSINGMLSRTLLTSGTTLLALIALYVFGGSVIRGFVDALIFGVMIGTYSSIFIATPTLLYIDPRKKDAAKVDDGNQSHKQIETGAGA